MYIYHVGIAVLLFMKKMLRVIFIKKKKKVGKVHGIFHLKERYPSQRFSLDL